MKAPGRFVRARCFIDDADDAQAESQRPAADHACPWPCLR
jgi:hypothetical protein